MIYKTADGKERGPIQASFEKGVLNIDVEAGELVRILGLPDGAVYTITEDMGFDHKQEEIYVKQNAMAAWELKPEATDIQIKSGSQVYVKFVNEVGEFGMLALRKIVSHNYKYGFDIPVDKEYVFRLTFEKKEQDANVYAGDVLYDMTGKAYALDKQGTMKENVMLKQNQEIIFTGLDAGTKVTVEEIVGPHEGFVVEEITATAASVDVKSVNTVQVAIESGAKASVTVHNLYKEPYVPQTGDNSRLILWTALLGLCAAGALLLKKRREH